MPWYYYPVRGLIKVLLLLFTQWVVMGEENLPRQGGVVVVANHLHNADPPILACSLRREVAFMAKRELFRSAIGSYVLSHLGAFPVSRGRINKEAVCKADEALARGLALIIFPEGGRSKTGQLQAAFPGSVAIALRNAVPILPVGITGTEQFHGRFWMMRRPRVVVNIGQPFTLPPVDGKVRKEELTQLAESVMENIARLLPPEYRGNYAAVKVRQ